MPPPGPGAAVPDEVCHNVTLSWWQSDSESSSGLSGRPAVRTGSMQPDATISTMVRLQPARPSDGAARGWPQGVADGRTQQPEH